MCALVLCPSSVAYFGVYEYLKEEFASDDGTVSSAGILSAGGFAGEEELFPLRFYSSSL